MIQSKRDDDPFRPHHDDPFHSPVLWRSSKHLFLSCPTGNSKGVRGWESWDNFGFLIIIYKLGIYYEAFILWVWVDYLQWGAMHQTGSNRWDVFSKFSSNHSWRSTLMITTPFRRILPPFLSFTKFFSFQVSGVLCASVCLFVPKLGEFCESDPV